MPVEGGGAPSETAAAIDAAAFAALMAPFAPFEPAPHLAVAVSGGADSTALCLLADHWARTRGGAVAALIVDHRLRAGSADEAAQVAADLQGRGIPAEILVRSGPAPVSRIQERARAARYALLCGWCRRAGVLHLLLAHHRQDQVETVLMRAARRTADDAPDDAPGGMTPVVDTPAVRILRPLLTVDPARLRATLATLGARWIEDPSNRDRRFERVRIRTALAAASDSGEAAIARATRNEQRRAAAEADAARALAGSLSVHPAGFAWLDADFAASLPETSAVRALAAVLTTIGGRPHYPDRAAVRRLLTAMCAERARPAATLHGCRIVRRGERLLLCRELRGVPPRVAVTPGAPVVWDRRFLVTVRGCKPADPLWLGALGQDGWRALPAEVPDVRKRGIPPAVAPTLPALYDSCGLRAVPHLGVERAAGEQEVQVTLRFRPPRPVLAGGTFLAAMDCVTM